MAIGYAFVTRLAPEHCNRPIQRSSTPHPAT
ncbi:uncharacterized protein METZ01_LOCUS357095, partial [marine metagenome]